MADKGNSASSAVDRLFESRSDQTKDYNISMGCFSAKHATLRRKNKEWLARNQDSVSLSGATYLSVDCCLGELQLWKPKYSWKFAELDLNNNHSLTIIYFFLF
jgi:hypothetical protein